MATDWRLRSHLVSSQFIGTEIMRIGTWNLDCRLPTDAHVAILRDQECDIWLLTEVKPRWVASEGRVCELYCHLSTCVMARGQHWAAVLGRKPLLPKRDPHPASAFAVVDHLSF